MNTFAAFIFHMIHQHVHDMHFWKDMVLVGVRGFHAPRIVPSNEDFSWKKRCFREGPGEPRGSPGGAREGKKKRKGAPHSHPQSREIRKRFRSECKCRCRGTEIVVVVGVNFHAGF